MQLQQRKRWRVGRGGGEKVCILQIFRGHHTTQLLRVRLKGSDDMTGVWSHLTVWETSARQTRVSDHLLSQHFFSFKEGRKKRLQVNLKACSHQSVRPVKGWVISYSAPQQQQHQRQLRKTAAVNLQQWHNQHGCQQAAQWMESQHCISLDTQLQKGWKRCGDEGTAGVCRTWSTLRIFCYCSKTLSRSCSHKMKKRNNNPADCLHFPAVTRNHKFIGTPLMANV